MRTFADICVYIWLKNPVKIIATMAGITKEIAEAKLTEYLTAETAVLAGQSYSIAGRSLTRADLQFIQKGIETWDARVKKFARSGPVLRGGTPI